MPFTIANGSGATISPWMIEAVPEYRHLLPPALTPDVVVIGAGITGLSTALALVRQGADVLVLDRGPIGGGDTARTSAHLASALDDRFSVLAKRFGAGAARLAAESHAVAIDLIEDHVRELGIDCDFRRVDGFLFGDDRELLEREHDAALEAGLVCQHIDRAPLPFDTGPCLRFAHQAQFHPLAYLRAIADAIVAGGGAICSGCAVARIHGGQRVVVELADGRRINAAVAIDCTNATITSRIDLPLRDAAYRTYALALAIPHGVVAPALYWDTASPYHYLRVAPGVANVVGEMLIVGGEDHRVGQGDPERAWRALETWTRERFDDAGEIVARWSGQIHEPADGLAYIGAVPETENVFVATGDSGHGLTHGVIASMILPGLILRGHHRYASLYDPARTHRHGFGTLLVEAMRDTVPYTDWLRGGDVSSLDDIPPGHGATIRTGVHVAAAYRDVDGQCHVCNARCPHLSGVVRWNDAEKTWDCPCHGSRFDALGHVLSGPATADLDELNMQSSPRARARAR